MKEQQREVVAFTKVPPTEWFHLPSAVDPAIKARVVDPEDRPWIPKGYGEEKYLRINPDTTEWVILARIKPNEPVPYHKHHCGLNLFVQEGELHFVDEDWTAGAGTFVHEPPGNTHVEVSEKGVLLLVWSQGPIEFLNADNTPGEVRDWLAWKKEVEDYHAAHSIPMPPPPGYFW